MTQYSPTFNVKNYELRGYTNPYLSPSQADEVTAAENRVNGQLDFLAQMLGWNGPNYWTNLPLTVDQKRQLLGGTFGVYNGYIIPRVYEVRSWDNKIVVFRDSLFPAEAQFAGIDKIVLGDLEYEVESVLQEGDKVTISIGTLTEEFLTLFEGGEPIKVSYPSSRPAPFYRPDVGISGDYTFLCGSTGSTLNLFPGYDTDQKFPVRFPVLFFGSTYYFNQPIYLAKDASLAVTIAPTYDPEFDVWVLSVPYNLDKTLGMTAYLVWEYQNATLEVTLQEWFNPSDWGSTNVLSNFLGTWGNKGGPLPFNFAFDSLSIHGFDERNGVYLPNFSTEVRFNDIINFIYHQKTVISPSSPPGAKVGDLWWNDETGILAVWMPSTGGCSNWVEIQYREESANSSYPTVSYVDVSTFQILSPTLPDGSIVRIENINGLTTTDNVIGLTGTITSPGVLILTKQVGTPYWEPNEFQFTTVSNFAVNSPVLPYEVPVVIFDSTGLNPSGGSYNIKNLSITITGQYKLRLQKLYSNYTWVIYPDSFLKYIAFSSLFGSPEQGEMWWDYANPDPNTRAASIFYSSPSPISSLSIEDAAAGLTDGVYLGVPLTALSGTGGLATADITVVGGSVVAVVLVTSGDLYQLGDIVGPDSVANPGLVGATFRVSSTTSQNWVDLNSQMVSGPPAPTLNLGSVLFYCNGVLLQDGVSYLTDDFDLVYTSNPVSGTYSFDYRPYTFEGRANPPEITISDSNTTVYRANITELLYSGIRYFISPNVYNAESPLRLWKAQDLQVVETVNHLLEKNYINPLLADLNSGPGPENWEKYFVRLPFDYGRNEAVWQKVALVCQNFATYGSSIAPEPMRCPPEDDLPAVYEELFLYGQPVSDYTYVYCEPYLYSSVSYFNSVETGQYQNSGVFPATDVEFDDFTEASLTDYDALHNRRANVTDPVNQGYGDWLGQYVNVNPCETLTGYLVTDLLNGSVDPVAAPVWDASIYKFPPTCENNEASYAVDANHYKIGYAYFVADASAAEDGFFDLQQEVSWRYPTKQPKTGYLLPG